MEVAWTTDSLLILGEWDRYTRDAVLDEFSKLADRNPDGLGTRIGESSFFSAPIKEGNFFVTYEWLQKNLILVRAVSRYELRNASEIDELISEVNAPRHPRL